MTSNIEADVMPEDQDKWTRRKEDLSQVNYETLINYWNNNQVIKMAGLAMKS